MSNSVDASLQEAAFTTRYLIGDLHALSEQGQRTDDAERSGVSLPGEAHRTEGSGPNSVRHEFDVRRHLT